MVNTCAARKARKPPDPGSVAMKLERKKMLRQKRVWRIAQILKDDGFIRGVTEIKDEKGFKKIEIELKYVDEVPAITGIKRWSKPGCRAYFGHSEIPRVLRGLGLGILTTSIGLLKDRDARRRKIGGELICAVW